MAAIDDQMQKRQTARAAFMQARSDYASAELAELEARRKVVGLRERVASTRRDFVNANEALKPLLDADVSGVLGKTDPREQELDEVAASLARKADPA